MIHFGGLFIENKMPEAKRVYESLNLIGSLTVAVSIPWVVFKLFKALCFRNGLKGLFGKVVVITGASSGLGEALAHEFYKRGCQVVLCARRRDELERVRNDLLCSHCEVQTHSPIIIPLDLSDVINLKHEVDKILSITDHIDILVNNGGISHRGTVLSTNTDVDIKVMTVNYFGSVSLTKAVLPTMVKRKIGHIVFISSIQGLVAIPERSAYAASKHALQAFADTLRAELATHNVQVTIASPGYIKTSLSLNALTGAGDAYAKMDASTERGYTPEFASERIVRAIVDGEKEVIISTLVPRLAIFLRRFCPSLYFFVMAKRFQWSEQKQVT